MTCFLILFTLSSQREVFNCNEVQFINDFLLWIVPLVLYLETCHHTMSFRFSTILSKEFHILWFTLGLWFILKFLFVEDVRSLVYMYLFAPACPVSPAILVEMTLCSILLASSSWSEICWLYLCDLFPESVVFHWSIYLLFAHHLDYWDCFIYRSNR